MTGWTVEVSALAAVAVTWPHAAYYAFTRGRIYVMRTIPNIGPLFEPLEDAIRLHAAYSLLYWTQSLLYS